MIRKEHVLCDLPGQIIKKQGDCYIELHERHLNYNLSYTSDEVENIDEEDESLWKWRYDEKNCHRLCVLRDNIIGVELSRGYSHYTVYVKLKDYSSLKIKFVKKSLADEMYEMLEAYILGTLSLTSPEDLKKISQLNKHNHGKDSD